MIVHPIRAGLASMALSMGVQREREFSPGLDEIIMGVLGRPGTLP